MAVFGWVIFTILTFIITAVPPCLAWLSVAMGGCSVMSNKSDIVLFIVWCLVTIACWYCTIHNCPFHVIIS